MTKQNMFGVNRKTKKGQREYNRRYQRQRREPSSAEREAERILRKLEGRPLSFKKRVIDFLLQDDERLDRILRTGEF